MRGCREGIERCGDTPQAVQSLKKHGKQLHALKSRRTPRSLNQWPSNLSSRASMHKVAVITPSSRAPRLAAAHCASQVAVLTLGFL
jgi:chromosomal replication initiation ATPase DnaA